MGLMLMASAFAEAAELPISASQGASPQLPAPEKSTIPTIKIARVKSWKNGEKPAAASGLAVQAFAQDLQHPRWLYVLPNGDVLVAETDTPPKPDDYSGVKGQVTKQVQKSAGSGANPSANQITLLRDADGDGVPEVRTVFITGLNAPIGMALIGNNFYVANTDAILRFPYKQGEIEIKFPGTKLTDLPGGALNHHWTKSLIASADGKKLYAGIGSNSNVAENGIDAEKERAAVWEIDPATGTHRIFASGLRNPVGLAFEHQTGALWVAVNERDQLGNNLPPDYMTAVQDGGFYGWPYSYFGQNVDERVQPPRPDLVAKAIPPDYALGAHTASLGLCSADGSALPPPFQQGMFVGQHGSWNRNPQSGYRVVFVAFQNGKPTGLPIDVLTDFLDKNGNARGRPVGVAIDKRGNLLVADDVGNRVWRVSTDQLRF
jgi:glucose/arabinose dehydrogenase